MILSVAVSLLLSYKGILCGTLIQSSGDQTVAIGSKLTVLCTYDMEFENPDLYWYRRRPDQSFQFILYRDDTRFYDADFVQGRFSVKHSKTHKTFHLVISSVRTEDAATYYCASGATVMQVLRKPAPKPLKHSLGVLPPRDGGVPECQASLSHSVFRSCL